MLLKWRQEKKSEFNVKRCITLYRRSKKEKEKKPSTYFNTNYHREMKLVPIIMDYCLIQFDDLKFFLGVCLDEGSQRNFIFFNVNPQIFQRNCKVHLTNCLETNFHNISIISLRDVRIIVNASF